MARWHPPVILRYGIAVLSIAIALGLALLARRFEGIAVTSFLMAIAIIVWYAGRGPGFLAIVLSVLSVDYFFTPPLYRFAGDLSNLPYLVIFTVFGLLFNWFSASRRRTEQELRQAHKELEVKVAERTAELRRSEALLAEGQRLTHAGTWARAIRDWSSLVEKTRSLGIAVRLPDSSKQDLRHHSLIFVV